MSIVLKGVMQSTVTPLKDDFSPDLPTFEKLVEFHVRTGATAIAWPHHKAESLNLTIAERKLGAEVAVTTVAGGGAGALFCGTPSGGELPDNARDPEKNGGGMKIWVSPARSPPPQGGE